MSQEQYERAVTEQVPVRFEQCFPPLDRLFEVRAHPGPDGLAVYVADTGVHRAAERDRDRALARLAQVDAVGSALSEMLDVDEALTRLAALLVPALADVCTIDLRDGDGPHGTRSVVTTAADPGKAEALRQADALLPRRDNPASSVHQVLAGRPLVHLVVTDELLAQVAAGPVQAGLWQQVQMRYVAVVPLTARGRVLGAISLARTGDGALPFTDDDLAFVQDVGRRAGLLVDDVVQYAAQRAVAEDLQRSLLPDLPALPGVAIGGRGVMIGTGIDAPRAQAAEEVPPGSTVLMFTDGLMERRGRDLDEQLEELARTATRLLAETGSPDELCHRLLATVRRDGGTDDAAVVALRLLPEG